MSGQRELRIAVVGLGFGANHARVLSELPGVKLAAVCDLDEARLSTATRGRDAKPYTDYRRLFAEEPLDAAIIAVPARLHETVALAAIGAGCAVLVEKPLAPTFEEGRRLATAATAAGVPLMAGHIERFNPAVRELVRRVRAGEAGRILQINARRLAYFAERSRDVDVGVVHDLALHEIDLMLLLLGTTVERAYAETWTGVRTPFDDSLSGLLRFQAGADGAPGAVGSLEVNWLSPRKVRELTVLGERGYFFVDYQKQTLAFQAAQALRDDPAAAEADLVKIAGAEPGPVVSIPIEPREPLAQELSAFLTALRDSAPMPVTGDKALAALAVAHALTESARTGLPVAPAWEA